jgi:hypothetical protein
MSLPNQADFVGPDWPFTADLTDGFSDLPANYLQGALHDECPQLLEQVDVLAHDTTFSSSIAPSMFSFDYNLDNYSTQFIGTDTDLYIGENFRPTLSLDDTAWYWEELATGASLPGELGGNTANV